MLDQARLGSRLRAAALSILLAGVCGASRGAPAPDAKPPAGEAGAAEATGLPAEVDGAGLTNLVAARRGAVVLVNFWATWCVPCREEFPDLSRLERELGPRGFHVIGVSTDFPSQGAAVKAFLAKTKPGFANYRKKSGADEQAFIDAVDRSWGGELPYSVLYARDGRKAKVLSGKHTYEEYRREIAPLLER